MVGTRTAGVRLPYGQLNLLVARGFWCRAQPESCPHIHKVREGRCLHLAHDLSAMRLHGDLRHAKLPAHLFVQEPADYQGHDVTLTRGELRVEAAKNLTLALLIERYSAACDGSADSIDQNSFRDGFGQEFHC